MRRARSAEGSSFAAIFLIACLSSCDASKASVMSQPADSAGLVARLRPEVANHLHEQEGVSQGSHADPDGMGVREPVKRGSSFGASGSAGDDVSRLVPAGVTVRMESRGDLDGDGDEDVLLVLRKDGKTERDPRELVLFRGTAGGRLEKSFSNPNAILCLSCGGTMGDPLTDIAITPGGFTLVFEGGSRELWSRTYSFRFSRKDRDWCLSVANVEILDRIDGHLKSHSETPVKPCSVSIRNFDASAMGQDTDTSGLALRRKADVPRPGDNAYGDTRVVEEIFLRLQTRRWTPLLALERNFKAQKIPGRSLCRLA